MYVRVKVRTESTHAHNPLSGVGTLIRDRMEATQPSAKGLWMPLLHSVAVVLPRHHSSVFTSVPVYLCPSPPQSHFLYLVVKRHVQHGLLVSASASAKDVPLCTKHINHSHLIIKFTSAAQPLSLDKLSKWALVVHFFSTQTSHALLTSPPLAEEVVESSKEPSTPSGFISRRSPNPFFLLSWATNTQLPHSFLSFSFFGLWIPNLVTGLNQLSHWVVSCSENSINHVGP